MRDTKPKTYRVTQECIDGVKRLAEKWDVTEGGVLERLVEEKLLFGGVGKCVEKKSGGAGKVSAVVDDLPDDLDRPMMGEDGRITRPKKVEPIKHVIKTPAEAQSLLMQRGVRAPLKRPGEK